MIVCQLLFASFLSKIAEMEKRLAEGRAEIEEVRCFRFSIYIAPLISSSSWDVRFDLLLLLLLLMLIDPRLAKSRS